MTTMSGKPYRACSPLGLGRSQRRAPPSRSGCPPTSRSGPAKGDPVGFHAQHRHEGRAQLGNLRFQVGSALTQLFRGEVAGCPGRGCHQVRDADAPVQEAPLLRGGEQPIGETGQVQRLPEAVTRPGKMLPQRAGHPAGIDSAKQHPQTRVSLHPGHLRPARLGRLDCAHQMPQGFASVCTVEIRSVCWHDPRGTGA